MKYFHFIAILVMALFLASNVSADIMSIGGTGGDEILFGYGNLFDLFFAGSDTIMPIISIISPEDGYPIYDYVSGSVPVTVTFFVNETNINSCWHTVDGGATITLIPCSNGFNNFITSFSSVGTFTLGVYINDTAGNESSDSIQIIVSAYTGPQQGGGSTIDPDEVDDDEFGEYNELIMCSRIERFLSENENYTDEDRTILKNELAIQLGYAITDTVLDKYLDEFDDLCLTDLPDEPSEPGEEDEVNYKNLFIFIIIIIVFILIAIIAYDHEKLTLILNRIRRKKETPKS